MDAFLEWLNSDSSLDLILKADIAHLWFVTVHPFDDGNGRIGKAIIDYLFAKSEGSSQRFYSLSSQIQQEKKEYYRILEETQKGNLDIILWIEWFIDCLGRAIYKSNYYLEGVLYKAYFWESLIGITFNERQNKLINFFLNGIEGKLTSSKWAKIAKCSQDTAYHDIQELLKLEILMKNPESNRSTIYSLVDKLAKKMY